MIAAILTDIEGTTTSISFVKDVLFPYARARLADFVRQHGHEPETRALLNEVGAPDDAQAVAQLIAWMDEDRKIAPLKALQGLIWASGYGDGDFHGHVYPDAARQLRAWKARGLALHIFSSGSVQAQKLLFGFTEFGDLTALFSGFFDTRIGAKQEAQAYSAIAGQIGLAPAKVLFLSDIGAELDAAQAAGMRVCQLLRAGAIPCENHPKACDFDAVDDLINAFGKA
jgi:enolase-phosphatase E1